jgi:hypothetical protein
MERLLQLKEQGRYPGIKLCKESSDFESIPDNQVFENVNEFFSYQTYNG